MDSFLDRVTKDKQYRESIIDYLCSGIKESSNFRDSIEYIINNKLASIKDGNLYEDEDDISFLILPSFRRVWAKVYIDIPTIFNVPEKVSSVAGYIPDKRLELYQLSFNIDEFIDYLSEMFDKCIDLLKDFKYLDKTNETLTLIVDNYVAMLVHKVTTCDNIEQEIRDLKIKHII